MSVESVLTQVRAVEVTTEEGKRLERAARDSFRFLWRCLRRFGVGSEDAVDDAVQRVFEIAAQKAHQIEPGRERAFLFKTALLVAAEERRRNRCCRELRDESAVDRAEDPGLQPDELVEKRQWREMLDMVLDKMEFDLRTVFVLFEFEQLSMSEIARLLEIPPGTVASRLRRAREVFQFQARILRGRFAPSGGGQ